MTLFSWLWERTNPNIANETRRLPGRKSNRRPKPPRFRPRVEALEGRAVLSTLTVDTPLDVVDGTDNVTSLREAILSAAPSGDTIAFDMSRVGPTISLTGGALSINKSLTVQGPGAGQLAISGGFNSVVMIVETSVQVVVAGLTIRDGFDAMATGAGGIWNQGTLTVSNCNVSYNAGSGIYNEGALTVSGSALSHNFTLYSGGGINNLGTLTVTSSTLSDNSSVESGGGIANSNSGTASITGSTLSNNVATGGPTFSSWMGGGGVWNNGTMTITGCNLTGNHADAGAGGGILNDDYSTLTIKKSTISSNSAARGGGIYNDFDALLRIYQSTVKYNSAGYIADLFNDNGTVLVKGSKIGQVGP